jgi:hypothetical protein
VPELQRAAEVRCTIPANLTDSEVFSLFRRSPADLRWIASADSQEYLALVAYLLRTSAGDKKQPDVTG